MGKTDENPLRSQLDVEEHGLKMCQICLRAGNYLTVGVHSVTGNRCGVIYWSDHSVTSNAKYLGHCIICVGVENSDWCFCLQLQLMLARQKR